MLFRIEYLLERASHTRTNSLMTPHVQTYLPFSFERRVEVNHGTPEKLEEKTVIRAGRDRLVPRLI